MNKATVLVLAVALIAGSTFAMSAEQTSQIPGLERLAKQTGKFQITLVDPDTDFTQYDKMIPQTVMLKFRGGAPRVESRSATGTNIRKRSKTPGAPSTDIAEKFKATVSRAFNKELGEKESFQLTAESGADTLILRTAIVDVVLNLPDKNTRRVESTADIVGEGTILFDLLDSTTGVIKARMADRRAIRRIDEGVSHYGASLTTEAALWSDIERWARRAAADLRFEIRKAKSTS
ncbi:MAG: DUF3313 domain-containing protein [bacterium]|nr:DUF3313 domain-containing protein [bacterium]